MDAGLLHAAFVAQHRCQVCLYLRQVRPQRQRPPQRRLSLRQTALRLQRDSEVIVSLCQSRIQCDRTATGRLGFRPTPLPVEYTAQVVVGLHIVGLSIHRLTVGRLCVSPALAGFPHESEINPTGRMPGIDGQNLSENDLGLVESALTE